MLTPNILARLYDLDAAINAGLDDIHRQTLAKFRTFTRSVGQRTRRKPDGMASKRAAVPKIAIGRMIAMSAHRLPPEGVL